MSKPHAGGEECLFLIQLKRKVARAAMQRIIEAIIQEPPGLPSVLIVLEYLSNMVYCIELMLKLLSGDWKSHNVDGMYKTAFQKPHPNSLLMNEIKTALCNQKYLLEPSGGLLGQVAGLEDLYHELITKVREAQNSYWVTLDTPVPAAFLEYLRDNGDRFYSKRFTAWNDTAGWSGKERAALAQKERQQDLDKPREHVEQWLKSGQPVSFFHDQIATLDWQ